MPMPLDEQRHREGLSMAANIEHAVSDLRIALDRPATLLDLTNKTITGTYCAQDFTVSYRASASTGAATVTIAVIVFDLAGWDWAASETVSVADVEAVNALAVLGAWERLFSRLARGGQMAAS